MIKKYILEEKEIDAKIKVEVSTSAKRTDGKFIPSSVKFFVNNKEVFSFNLDPWDDDNRYFACELLEAFGYGTKEAHRITYGQNPMELKKTVEI